jgi:imidazolonepropionase-like amidohydrolase
MITLVENGEVYAPELLGRRDVLIVNDRIVMIGEVDRRGLKALGHEHKVIDAIGCVVTPGFIDPHEHLLGGRTDSALKRPRSTSARSSPPALPQSSAPWASIRL